MLKRLSEEKINEILEPASPSSLKMVRIKRIST